jgi:hypothetical protein
MNETSMKLFEYSHAKKYGISVYDWPVMYSYYTLKAYLKSFKDES